MRLLVVVAIVASMSCASVAVKTSSASPEEATHARTKLIWFWGLLNPGEINASTDCTLGAVNVVTRPVLLVTVLTLGIVTPVSIKYQCPSK